MAPLIDHEGAFEGYDRRAVTFVPGGLDRHDPDAGPRLRLSLLEDLGARVDGVPLEDRGRQADLVPAQVGEDVLGDVRDALAGYQREREGRIHERSAELCLGGVVVVEVYRRGVLGEQREPDVVCRGDRSPKRVPVEVPDFEVLEEPPPPTFL